MGITSVVFLLAFADNPVAQIVGFGATVHPETGKRGICTIVRKVDRACGVSD
jgi:hypothetical protein